MTIRLAAAAIVLVSGCSLLFDSGAKAPAVADGSVAVDAPLGDAAEKFSAKRIFVTSSKHSGNVGGLLGADSICQSLADEVGLDGVFKVWLSSGEKHAADRLTHWPGPYQLVTGREVAKNWDDLVDGNLSEAINRTEAGAVPESLIYICTGGEVWTNTRASGLSADENSSASCDGWHSDQFRDDAATVGLLSAITEEWSDSCPRVTCANKLPFYCIEQ